MLNGDEQIFRDTIRVNVVCSHVPTSYTHFDAGQDWSGIDDGTGVCF